MKLSAAPSLNGMLSKSISTNSLVATCLVFVLWMCAETVAQEDTISNETPFSLKVIYPKEGQTIGAVDSTFIFGHIQNLPRDNVTVKLLINSWPVVVHEDGGWLAFLPIEPGDSTFVLTGRVIDENGVTHELNSVVRQVGVPQPIKSIASDSLTIAGAFGVTSRDLSLVDGQRLCLQFRGTPGGRAWAVVEGVDDSIPMSETEPHLQAYWGEAVFGASAVPDSLKIAGIYSGFLDITSSMHADSAGIEYWLAPPSPEMVFARYFFDPHSETAKRSLKFLAHKDTLRVCMNADNQVSLNADDLPFAVQFTDTVQIVRHGPRKGYLSIFQPQGIKALVVGAEGEWYRLQLSETQVGWVHRNSVERLPVGVLPPKSHLALIRIDEDDDCLQVRFPLSGLHPFRIEETNRKSLRIQLFGVTHNTDWIRNNTTSKMVDLVTFRQVEPDLYECVVDLHDPIWGYDAFYESNTLVLQLNKPPAKLKSLKGKTIVIDPGHSADPGAIGPTGYTEAEANLGISLVVREMLLSNGAKVVMTRSDSSDVPLYDRPAIARTVDADLFVSIHNNALPDGVNPFTHNGSSAYYYHPHSADLARHLHRELLKASRLPDHGFYHGNLAVARPTQYPAVLIECAFMMIPEQEAALKTDKFRKRIAKGIVKGIKEFLKEADRVRK